jgi:hypothetical protein
MKDEAPKTINTPHKESRRMKNHSFQTKVTAAIMLVVILLMLGTVLYSMFEGWSLLDSTYFTTITLTTIGYGDLAPTHAITKIITMFFAFAGVTIFVFAVSTITESYFGKRVGSLETKVQQVSDQTKQLMRPPEQTKAAVSRRSFVKDMVIEHKKPKPHPVKFDR